MTAPVFRVAPCQVYSLDDGDAHGPLFIWGPAVWVRTRTTALWTTSKYAEIIYSALLSTPHDQT